MAVTCCSVLTRKTESSFREGWQLDSPGDWSPQFITEWVLQGSLKFGLGIGSCLTWGEPNRSDERAVIISLIQCCK